MTKANPAPIELSTAAAALLERTRLLLEVPGTDSRCGTILVLSLNEHPAVCGFGHTMHWPKRIASRLHAIPLAE